MNKLSLLVASATLALAGTAAFAQEATPDYPQAVSSNVTRAQVQAELAQAKRDGSMRAWSTSYNPFAAARSLKTRDEVRAELMGGDRALYAALSGEDSGAFALARQPLRGSVIVVAARP